MKDSISGIISTCKGCPSAVILMISSSMDPRMIGMLIRKENFALSSLSPPLSSPADNVVPERERPGKIAKPCAIPMIIARLYVILAHSTSFVILFERFCEIINSIPLTKNVIGSINPSNDDVIRGINATAIRHVKIVAR